jgi:uncharacterized protein YecT (DUF1311 family)
MTTDPAGQPWDGTTYRGFSGPAPEAAAPRPRGWPMSRTLAVGVGGAVVLGLVLGVLARPTLNRSAAAPPMRAVTAAEDNTPARMDIEVNALPPPPPIVRSAGRLDVLPPGAAQAASRPPPVLAGLSVEPPQSAQAAAAAAAEGCQAVHGRAAQMVCADPDLSAADRELNQAYRRALRSGAAPEQLQQDQRDWLAIREDAARRSPRAVASIYEQRIDELNEIADEGPG